jgi:hypothetical protein
MCLSAIVFGIGHSGFEELRMSVLIINFQLNGVSDEQYRALVESAAPVFTTVPGLISKVFLADAESNTYGGVYFFESRAAIEAYLQSEIVAGLKANSFTGVTAKIFDAIEAATAVTQGPLPIVATPVPA